MNRTIKIQRALEAVSCGMSLSAAAQKYHIARSSLRVEAQRLGVLSGYQKHIASISDCEKEAMELRKSGLSFSKISKKLEINHATVKRWCKDIPISQEDYMSNFCREPEKMRLAVEYRKQGMFVGEIADKLDCSKSSVSLWLKKARLKDSSLDAHSHERKTKDSFEVDAPNYLERVVSLRLTGYGFGEIAKEINKTVDFVRYTFSLFDCSDEQKKEIKKLNNKRTLARRHSGELKPVGGIRKGVERSKFGYYKGIYCSSTYELCWVIYNLDHGKKVERFNGFLESKDFGFKYYPDFIEDGNHIIEIKGYEREDVAQKTKLAESLGYRVTLLKEKDLQSIFEYVDKKYGTNCKNRHVLYDNHKPVHVFLCSHCKKDFEVFEIRQRHKDGLPVFCNSKCSALYRYSLPEFQNRKKISTAQSHSIKIDRSNGLTFRGLALKYNVSIATIQSVLKKP